MQIRQLEYLAAVAREQHFGRAAASCHVSQASLSSGILNLERELGVRVVDRGTQFVGLTAEGERVLAWARRIMADVDGLREDVGSMRGELSGTLRIAAIPTALTAIGGLTAAFSRRYPAVRLSVESMSSREIERLLHRFELDVGVTYLDNEPLTGMRAQLLYRERYLLLTSSDAFPPERPTVTWPDAAAGPLALLTPEMQNRRIVDSLFAEAGVVPRPLLETTSISALCAHVRAGGSSAVIAHPWVAWLELEGLRAIPLVGPERSHAVGMVVLDREPPSLLASALNAVARELVAAGGGEIPVGPTV